MYAKAQIDEERTWMKPNPDGDIEQVNYFVRRLCWSICRREMTNTLYLAKFSTDISQKLKSHLFVKYKIRHVYSYSLLKTAIEYAYFDL